MANELLHYGILGMKWGVRRYQDKSGKLTSEGKSRIKDKVMSKSSAKLQRINTQYTKKQTKANKALQKADRSQYGIFTNEERFNKKLSKANKLQSSAYKSAYRGQKWYNQMKNEFKKVGFKMDSQTISTGERFIKDIENRTKQTYLSMTYTNRRR